MIRQLVILSYNYYAFLLNLEFEAHELVTQPNFKTNSSYTLIHASCTLIQIFNSINTPI